MSYYIYYLIEEDIEKKIKGVKFSFDWIFSQGEININLI